MIRKSRLYGSSQGGTARRSRPRPEPRFPPCEACGSGRTWTPGAKPTWQPRSHTAGLRCRLGVQTFVRLSLVWRPRAEHVGHSWCPGHCEPTLGPGRRQAGLSTLSWSQNSTARPRASPVPQMPAPPQAPAHGSSRPQPPGKDHEVPLISPRASTGARTTRGRARPLQGRRKAPGPAPLTRACCARRSRRRGLGAGRRAHALRRRWAPAPQPPAGGWVLHARRFVSLLLKKIKQLRFGGRGVKSWGADEALDWGMCSRTILFP